MGQKPYLGWSTFSQQTIQADFLTQATVQAQSDALHASGLQQHGFEYINIDSGWMGSFDGNGRPVPNTTIFPNIKALVDHIHANGQKAGIYWIPGIQQPAVDANYPILNTRYHTQDIVAKPYAPGNAFAGTAPNPYHDKIDFTKPGAQEYMNSVVALFASWGIDFIKLDGVTPGSYSDNESIDNRPDVEAWSKAIAASGRSMWFTISWRLDQDYLSTWEAFSNARRIDDDVECEGRCGTLTNWPRILLREYDSVGWEHSASSTQGWNDLDSLDVINGSTDGLTDDEKQTAITLWAMANAPLSLGGDLTKLDAFAKEALTNDEVLAVDQTGHPAVQVTGGQTPVWTMDAGDGSVYVAVYNLNAFATNVTVKWSDLGFANARRVRDVWNHLGLGASIGSFSTQMVGHGSRLLKVTKRGAVAEARSEVYEAESAILSGSASVAQCSACSGGSKAGNLGGSRTSNSVTFNNVRADRAGVYRMEVDALTLGPRPLVFSVNGGPSTTLNLSGGSFNLPESTTVPVSLQRGLNTVVFYATGTYAADLDRIVISGDGKALRPGALTYEAEDATLAGSASVGGCGFCSAGGKAGNLGGASTVTFSNVMVPSAGEYQLEVDYLTSGPRSFQVAINDGTPLELDLNGSTFDSPATTAITVPLHAGANKIVFGSAGYGPDLDSITVGPVVTNSNLTGAITRKAGLPDLRLWQLTLRNQSAAPATKTRLNSFTLAGTPNCKATALLPLPLPLGTLEPGAQRNVPVPIALSPGCRPESTLTLDAVFSANNGADVGTLTSTVEAQ